MYLLIGCAALLWGMAADYYGTGIRGLAAAVWLFDPAKFSICLGALGFFSGIYQPTGLELISKGIKLVSVVLGYNGIFGNLGLASALFITGISTWQWGPQSAYFNLRL